jgi:IMP and pyridine-specific 5'-nucleotidase
MGGECNYLLRVNPATMRLEFVPDDDWQTPEMLAWDEDDIKVCYKEGVMRRATH